MYKLKDISEQHLHEEEEIADEVIKKNQCSCSTHRLSHKQLSTRFGKCPFEFLFGEGEEI